MKKSQPLSNTLIPPTSRLDNILKYVTYTLYTLLPVTLTHNTSSP